MDGTPDYRRVLGLKVMCAEENKLSQIKICVLKKMLS